ncbi:GspE/PulE family protein [Comamonas endophytica]|uniref:GspE/PulE family protein n=1 Tax=Comamonas endophytica TaxID=2949090 RepID=A0ABY6GCF0_9BURK|nr:MULTISPECIES: GspE/PulE family protein [unclassified Acidovorax]MCD2513780.1 GspE/PulE family protein [Acidovorax sp. D4N7]UYG52217.1 GspE/PulE family protein [Acidovorax sp. 5MLIR]
MFSAQALLDSQGVALLDGAALEKARVSAIPGVAEGLRVELPQGMLLLFDDPWSSTATQCLQRLATAGARLALAQPAQLLQLRSRVSSEADSSVPTRPVPASGAEPASMAAGPVVAFVNEAIERAYADGASDIHFESDRQGVGVKYRLDGVMARGPRMEDPQRAEEIISRIKVLAQLDITERRRPQDGRIHWQPSGGVEAVDLRVSIMPGIFGEDAVLRLLDKAQLRHGESGVSLDLLGFDGSVAPLIRDLATRPHGMLLITGPTGSGKTTTVYAALSEVNDGLEKIITIEDPVEYELPGVLQIPVNEQKGLTFATGLRSILRHDPDKILVGEIRDAETARIAVQSSLTGHLVFTTVHANSLLDVLGRFQHFGIEAFALASALNGVVVQRLLRQACQHCLQWRETTVDERARIAAQQTPVPERMPCPSGCPHCRHTGYKGRFVVAEVHMLSDHVRDLMVARASMSEFKQAVYRDPAQRLIAQAIHLVGMGKTTLAEVTRVVGLA